MRTSLLGLMLLASMSSFATVYNGTDSEGRLCSLELKKGNNGTYYFVQVKTDRLHATSYDYKGINKDGIIDVSDIRSQGNQDMNIKTTDRIIVKFSESKPVAYSVSRVRLDQQRNFLGFLSTVNADASGDIGCKLD